MKIIPSPHVVTSHTGIMVHEGRVIGSKTTRVYTNMHKAEKRAVTEWRTVSGQVFMHNRLWTEPYGPDEE